MIFAKRGKIFKRSVKPPDRKQLFALGNSDQLVMFAMTETRFLRMRLCCVVCACTYASLLSSCWHWFLGTPSLPCAVALFASPRLVVCRDCWVCRHNFLVVHLLGVPQSLQKAMPGTMPLPQA